MRKLIVAAVIAIYFLSISALAQVKPVASNNHPSITRTSSAPTTTATRARIMDNRSATSVHTAPATKAPVGGNGPISNVSERPRHVAPTAAGVTSTGVPTQVYRVGVGDILDIQIPDSMSTTSTLYTVMEGGMLDYPLAGSTLSVSGLTTDAIAARLRASIRVLDNPTVNVRVRDYASHTVNVIGFVHVPGTKVLRREAVPLYVVLSEAMPLAEAGSVTIVRGGRETLALNLKDANGTSLLVMPGDVIKVSGTPTVAAEYFFSGGEVNAPGQKAFHPGLTLTQAILASGGTSRNAGNSVRVSRQSTDGRLVTAEYNLQSIQTGKTADPILQKGDRMEVSRNQN
jgi:protein involved in polysaccharide export with SLBB domain